MSHLACLALLVLSAPQSTETAPAATPTVRHVQPGETWELREGRFYRNGTWIFLKTGKLLRAFEDEGVAARAMADIDVLVEKLNYNNISLNIYPDGFDSDADGQIDARRKAAFADMGRMIDHCWERGVFCSLSFETYNVGGGGIPPALFERHPDIVAHNALGEPARDVEYGGDRGKLIPSIFHPVYLRWSRSFMRSFLDGLGSQRASRLLYVETTVEPQYLGRCNVGDKDDRRAFLDFSPAARMAFVKWQQSFPADDPHRKSLEWPVTQAQRDSLMGHKLFNEFRGRSLGQWVSGDIAVIRSVAADVYIAVDYNGRADDVQGLRVGDVDAFLNAIEGANIIQVAPHTGAVWGDSSWGDVIRVNRKAGRHWAISEHMTVSGDWPAEDEPMIANLENTLVHGTGWGWEFVNAGNRHAGDPFHLYNEDWTSPTLDVIEGHRWPDWLSKINAPRFVPSPRGIPSTIPASQGNRSRGALP